MFQATPDLLVKKTVGEREILVPGGAIRIFDPTMGFTPLADTFDLEGLVKEDSEPDVVVKEMNSRIRKVNRSGKSYDWWRVVTEEGLKSIFPDEVYKLKDGSRRIVSNVKQIPSESDDFTKFICRVFLGNDEIKMTLRFPAVYMGTYYRTLSGYRMWRDTMLSDLRIIRSLGEMIVIHLREVKDRLMSMGRWIDHSKLEHLFQQEIFNVANKLYLGRQHDDAGDPTAMSPYVAEAVRRTIRIHASDLGAVQPIKGKTIAYAQLQNRKKQVAKLVEKGEISNPLHTSVGSPCKMFYRDYKDGMPVQLWHHPLAELVNRARVGVLAGDIYYLPLVNGPEHRVQVKDFPYYDYVYTREILGVAMDIEDVVGDGCVISESAAEDLSVVIPEWETVSGFELINRRERSIEEPETVAQVEDRIRSLEARFARVTEQFGEASEELESKRRYTLVHFDNPALQIKDIDAKIDRLRTRAINRVLKLSDQISKEIAKLTALRVKSCDVKVRASDTEYRMKKVWIAPMVDRSSKLANRLSSRLDNSARERVVWKRSSASPAYALSTKEVTLSVLKLDNELHPIPVYNSGVGGVSVSWRVYLGSHSSMICPGDKIQWRTMKAVVNRIKPDKEMPMMEMPNGEWRHVDFVFSPRHFKKWGVISEVGVAQLALWCTEDSAQIDVEKLKVSNFTPLTVKRGEIDTVEKLLRRVKKAGGERDLCVNVKLTDKGEVTREYGGYWSVGVREQRASVQSQESSIDASVLETEDSVLGGDMEDSQTRKRLKAKGERTLAADRVRTRGVRAGVADISCLQDEYPEITRRILGYSDDTNLQEIGKCFLYGVVKPRPVISDTIIEKVSGVEPSSEIDLLVSKVDQKRQEALVDSETEVYQSVEGDIDDPFAEISS